MLEKVTEITQLIRKSIGRDYFHKKGEMFGQKLWNEFKTLKKYLIDVILFYFIFYLRGIWPASGSEPLVRTADKIILRWKFFGLKEIGDFTWHTRDRVLLGV